MQGKPSWLAYTAIVADAAEAGNTTDDDDDDDDYDDDDGAYMLFFPRKRLYGYFSILAQIEFRDFVATW